jgi:hypothetical protein
MLDEIEEKESVSNFNYTKDSCYDFSIDTGTVIVFLLKEKNFKISLSEDLKLDFIPLFK